MAAALDAASAAAYGAVGRPVEGTILTVARVAAESGRAAADSGADLLGVLEAARAGGGEALAETPELLPVLKEAGVVDAGGTGLLLLLDVALNLVDGRAVPEPDDDLEGASAEFLQAFEAAHGEGGHDGGLADLRYEVMYFLEAPDESIPGFKDMWATLGDSIVVVGGDGLWNCHIHTDDIGAAIEAGIDVGTPAQHPRHRPARRVRRGRGGALGPRGRAAWRPSRSIVHEPVPCAVVAVSVGDGVRRIFQSLGVQGVVTGGQTMNPSTAQLLEAVEAAPADAGRDPAEQQEHHPGGRAGRRHDLQDGPRRAHPRRRRGLRLAARLRPRAPRPTTNADGDGRGRRARRRRRGHPGGPRLHPPTAARSARATGSGIARDGIIAVDDDLVGRGHHAARPAGRPPSTRSSPSSRARAPSQAITRHLEVWLHDNRAGCEVEVHHGGQPLYPYLFGIE